MFLNNKPKSTAAKTTEIKKGAIPTVITKGMHILGNIVGDSVVDFNGILDGNLRCELLTVRENGVINGEITAETVFIFGKVKGIIRAKHVHLHAGCRIEGIVMHESLSIEDGAFIDGKCKRTDKVEESSLDFLTLAESDSDEADSNPKTIRMLDNIRLIS